MATDRLTPLDTSFLHLEDPATHMHVACVMVFEGDPPRYGDFVEFVASRLHLVPRYRQKLGFVPLGQGRPRWVDDESFDVRYHVRSTALPSPGGEHELEVLAGRVFGQQLNRDKPLWEMWLVEGLEGGRFAVLSKTHHALVDGISGLDILSVLFAGSEEARDPAGWVPRPAPSPLGLLAEALRGAPDDARRAPASRPGAPAPAPARGRAPGRGGPGRGRVRAGGAQPRALEPLQRAPRGGRPALRLGSRLPGRPQGHQELGRRHRQRRGRSPWCRARCAATSSSAASPWTASS